jgi:ribonuclease T1
MASQEDARTRALEEQALRAHGLLGRSGPYGNSLFAFEYELLPLEAKDTIELIARGGPFPYSEDGGLYGNRSRDLPGETTLYREFTVLTPADPHVQTRLRRDGKPHRGRRRIVAKANGLLFFTLVHYDRVQGVVNTPEHAQAVSALDEQWRNGFYLITGMKPSLRHRVSQGLLKIHNSRLPAVVGTGGQAQGLPGHSSG